MRIKDNKIWSFFILSNPIIPILIFGCLFSLISYFSKYHWQASGSIIVCCGIISQIIYESFSWRKEIPAETLTRKKGFKVDGRTTNYTCYLISPFPIGESSIISYRYDKKGPNQSATKGKMGALTKFIQEEDVKVSPKFIRFHPEDDYVFKRDIDVIPLPPKPFIHLYKIRKQTRTAVWAYRRTVERVESYIFYPIIFTIIVGTIIWGYGDLISPQTVN